VNSSSQAPAIVLDDVRKSYGSLTVLDRLSLQVNPGDVYGFLGRNGAGKSTTIRLLMGISQLDGGSIMLFGNKAGPNKPRLRQRIGYVAQEQHFYPWMTPSMLGDFVKGFYPGWSKQRYATLMARFDLPSKRKIGTFSGGMKAKLALSVALATQPTLLVLDEPTAGMDPVARREFLDLVQEQTADGAATVFFSTHLIDDIESIANRIGIVEAGHAIYEGPLSALRESVVSYTCDSQAEQIADWPLDPVQRQFHLLEDRLRGMVYQPRPLPRLAGLENNFHWRTLLFRWSLVCKLPKHHLCNS